jgi:hypothetical protein
MTGHRSIRGARLVLFDGKQVGLGRWDTIAGEFAGPDLPHAITACCGCKARVSRP